MPVEYLLFDGEQRVSWRLSSHQPPKEEHFQFTSPHQAGRERRSRCVPQSRSSLFGKIRHCTGAPDPSYWPSTICSPEQRGINKVMGWKPEWCNDKTSSDTSSTLAKWQWSERKFKSQRTVSLLSHSYGWNLAYPQPSSLIQLYLSSAYSVCQVLWIYRVELCLGERDINQIFPQMIYNCTFWSAIRRGVWYYKNI